MAMEPPLTLSLSSGDAELPLDDQRYAGEGLIDLEQAGVIDAEAGGLQDLAGSVQDWHAGLRQTVQSYSL